MNLSVSLKRFLFASVCIVFVFTCVGKSLAQDRDRVIEKPVTENKKEEVEDQIRPTTQTPKNPTGKSPGLTNEIVIVKNQDEKEPLVKKISSSRPVNESPVSTSRYYAATTRAMMMQSIRAKLGIRYRYATQGPYTYDCSGFVWKVFEEAGIPIVRTSASQFWSTFEPVFGNDRFQFGTLVFFNRLGHVGIVADENGFYHASSSKGVTYSRFDGYWSKRIVGYRRVPFYQDKVED